VWASAGEGGKVPAGLSIQAKMPDSQTIGRLPPNVAGKVRGSVVAPSFASAVVELVLNALDAASTKIHVQVDIENMQFQASVSLTILSPRCACRESDCACRAPQMRE
jgi:hypothetical protein